ncbi:hypothetical protein DEO72_LG3g2777 [Vigna unguiculata]|uniref:Epidermal patterning factor-like protein n=1 Tax=Vigna unguiculata TaxID=3917 RepID=A0A4D6LIV9_VIGUN|nr:hypothetical protein DEO72_LG3g2777 [Vigna unguiculata]
MDSITNQSRVCRNVFFFCLFCTLIFSSSAASTKADSENVESLVSSTGGAKRFLRGWSKPPTCFSRCLSCTPCTPILVATPPSARRQTAAASEQPDTASRRPDDYYPTFWKCTCGGKLYDA